MENKRDVRIDILKGIGIILVVWGHVSSYFSLYIYTFHMPLFFFCSGYLMSKQRIKNVKFKDYFIKKVKTILIPYILFWFITVIVYQIIFYKINFGTWINFDFDVVKGLLFGGHYLAENSNNFTLWFLQLFFISSIVFFILIKYNNKYANIAVFILLIIVTIPVQKLLPGRPIFHINVLPSALVFTFMGYYFKVIKDKYKSKLITFDTNIFGFLSILIGWRMSTIFYGDISNIGNYLYFLGALNTIIGIYILSKNLINSKILGYLGKNSIYILAFHGITFYTVNNFLTYFTLNLSNEHILIYNIIYVILILTTSSAIGELYKDFESKIIK